MIKIAICDDDINIVNQVEALVIEAAKEIKVQADIECYSDGDELVKSIKNGEKYTMIFIDVEMKVMDGLATARIIREKDKNVLFIYMSSYDKYCADMFEIGTFRFLNKPIDKKKFKDYFIDAYNHIEDDDDSFQYKYNKVQQVVKIKDIVYFQSDNRKIRMYLVNGEVIEFYDKLNNIEARLEYRNHMVRIHQSYIVNLRNVEKINFEDIILKREDEIITLPISSKYKESVRSCLFAHIK